MNEINSGILITFLIISICLNLALIWYLIIEFINSTKNKNEIIEFINSTKNKND